MEKALKKIKKRITNMNSTNPTPKKNVTQVPDLRDNIDFSYNWNKKLNGDYWTTIRLYNPNKYKVDQLYNTRLKSNSGMFMRQHCISTIVNIKTIRLDDINEFIAGIDTGYSVTECKELIRKMYIGKVPDLQSQRFMLILNKRVKVKTAELF